MAIALLVTLATVSTWAYFQQSFLTSEMATLAGKEKTQRERAELQLHYSQVARGATALDAKNYRGAEAALDDRAPFELRGWDYRYLQRQLQGTPLSLRVPPAPVRQIAFSPDTKQFATGSLVGEVTMWSFESGRPLLQFEVGRGTIAALHFHPRRQELIAASLPGLVGRVGRRLAVAETLVAGSRRRPGRCRAASTRRPARDRFGRSHGEGLGRQNR